MNKRLPIVLGLTLCFLVALAACKKKPPLSERIAKAWVAESVKHDNVQVYIGGGDNNSAPGYSNYALRLNSDKTVTLTEFEGTTFTGTWELRGETGLILRGLGPVEPTGSNGTLEYTIKSIEDNKLVISLVSTSIKTGNTINEYTLVVR
jgi:hypothetical protein